MGTSEHWAVVDWEAWWGLEILFWSCLAPDVSPSLGEVLALGLRVFLELMEHGMVSWETLSIPFVRKVGGLFEGHLVGAVRWCQDLIFCGGEMVTTPYPFSGSELCEHEPDGCLCAAPGPWPARKCDLEQPCPGTAGQERGATG